MHDNSLMLTASREHALNSISGHIKKGKKMLEVTVSNVAELDNAKAAYRKWREYAQLMLRNLFSGDSMANRMITP